MGFLLCGCFGGGGSDGFDVRTVEVGIGAAVAIGQPSALAMRAMQKTVGCASVKSQCSGYPCGSGSVEASYGADCPLPLGSATGTVTVSGSWQSADSASVSNVYAGSGENVVVVNTRSVSVSRASASGPSSTTTIRYTGQNVDVRGGTTLAAQSSWTVVVDDAGTPDDANDDEYAIDGVEQGAGGVASGQISLSDVVVDPSCRLNPIAGDGVIQSVSGFSVRQERIKFHAACDGTADVTSTLGGSSKVNLKFLAK